MCLAVPARIESLEGSRGTAVLGGNRISAVFALVPEAKVGDWVLLHAGYAIALLDPEEAKATYDLLSELEA